IAQGQPGIAGIDGAIEQAHAGVFQVQREGTIPNLAEGTEIDLQEVNAVGWLCQYTRRELGQDLIESAVRVWKLGGLWFLQGKGCPTQAAKEVTEISLHTQVAGGPPFFVARKGRLVKRPAGSPCGKDKGVKEELRADFRGPAVAAGSTENETVEIAIDSIG